MKKMMFSVLLLVVAAVSAQAKSWKIGPSSVVGMDFASINAAMESESVVAGDTLYLDQFYNENVDQTVTKAVVIIGTGYDTSLTDEQVVAQLTSRLSLKADSIIVKSVKLKNVFLYNTDCIIDRCQARYIGVSSVSANMNHIYSCYLIKNEDMTDGVIKGYSEEYPSQLDIQNCVIYHYHNYSSSKVTENTIQYLKQSIINNNVIYRDVINWSYYSSSNPLFVNGALGKICNSVITNNYIFGACSGRYYNSSYSDNTFYSYDLTSNIYSSGSGNTIEHNIFSRSSSLTYYPTNKVNYFTLSKVFTCSGTFSNYYQLSEVSPAKGYATDGGDCGVHGGLFGCPSGGRPQYIPYFTKVRVNSRTENGKLPVSVSVKIQDE